MADADPLLQEITGEMIPDCQIQAGIAREVGAKGDAAVLERAAEKLSLLVERVTQAESLLTAEREHYQQHGTSKFFRDERDQLATEVQRLRGAIRLVLDQAEPIIFTPHEPNPQPLVLVRAVPTAALEAARSMLVVPASPGETP